MSKKTTKSVPTNEIWTSREKEIALRLYGKLSMKGISAVLARQGYIRTPSAVSRLICRLKENYGDQILEPKGKVQEQPNFSQFEAIRTSWGEPMLVQRLEMEFGQGSSLIPVAFLPDKHCPFHDPWAVELACKILEVFKPLWVIDLGDEVDWAQISKFDNDPARMLDLYNEVRSWHGVRREIMSAVGPDVRNLKLLGNHENRLERYFWAKAAQMIGIPGNRYDVLLGMDENFKVLENLQIVADEIVWRQRFVIKHGDVVRKFTCFTAKAELEKEQISGISGHTHRMGTYSHSNRGRATAWTEAGCLCDLQPEYVKNPNWQQGICLGWFNGDGKNDYFHIEPITFSHYRAVALGQGFEVTKTVSVS